ncbi:hypothetical protein HY30_14170 [Hyphomonas chukchiensis]|uniref:Uncharacterized protein n=2 Tax=Hyphomonas chukchiensis TaxID=1280947 RepID=A0A062UR21_9PROT|nr:hypothetical protein HY30_14170 [Hyphomonas chukchiensis]
MKYDRQWVAVRYNEVIAARHNVRELITLVSEISGMDDPIKEKPVISFVTAGILQ